MCGRYTQSRSLAELAKRFQALLPEEESGSFGEVAPTQAAPVVLRDGATARLRTATAVSLRSSLWTSA